MREDGEERLNDYVELLAGKLVRGAAIGRRARPARAAAPRCRRSAGVEAAGLACRDKEMGDHDVEAPIVAADSAAVVDHGRTSERARSSSFHVPNAARRPRDLGTISTTVVSVVDRNLAAVSPRRVDQNFSYRTALLQNCCPFATRRQSGECGPERGHGARDRTCRRRGSRRGLRRYAGPREAAEAGTLARRRASGEVELVLLGRWARAGGRGGPLGRQPEVGQDFGDGLGVLDGGKGVGRRPPRPAHARNVKGKILRMRSAHAQAHDEARAAARRQS